MATDADRPTIRAGPVGRTRRAAQNNTVGNAPAESQTPAGSGCATPVMHETSASPPAPVDGTRIVIYPDHLLPDPGQPSPS